MLLLLFVVLVLLAIVERPYRRAFTLAAVFVLLVYLMQASPPR